MRDHRANADTRNDRWAKLFVGICAAVLTWFICTGSSSCVALPGGGTRVDWNKVDVAGDEIVSLLDAASVTWGHSPGAVEDLQRLKAAVQLLDAGVETIRAGGSASEFNAYLAAAIELTDELAAQAGDDDLRATFSSIRLALGALRVGLA